VWLAQQAAFDLWQAWVAAKANKTLLGIKALRLQAACLVDLILAKFSPDFTAQGRGENVEGEREAL
jgi:hypothetical protein